MVAILGLRGEATDGARGFGRATSFVSALVALCAVIVVAAVANAQDLPTSIPQTKFSSGQNVVPYFEGWIRNGDGSFDLVFGYFNRN